MAEVIKKEIVKFAPKGADSFYDEVKAKVNEYFTANNISQYSNSKMYWKTVAMLSMYFVPYFLIVSGVIGGYVWLSYLCWLIMGAGIVGIGTSIMHDSNHGAYSDNKALNNFLGAMLNVIGGYAKNWRIQHNILHHTYTNIEGLDEDIEAGAVLRMSPEKPLRGFHRYQHIYAWFVYCIMNLYWVTVKDFKNLVGYHKNGLLVKQKISLSKSVTELVLLKLFYIAYIVVVPILVSGVPWYHVVGGILAMHVVAGLALACIFQPAHVIETSDFSRPDDKRKMENSWAVHQVLNTADFAPNNKLVSWFIGGLNFQIEHHLFPQVCHVHYPQIARIVKATAKEHGIPYTVMPTFRSAVVAHGRMLRKLGRNEDA